MYINPVVVSTNNNENFKGSLKLKGKWPIGESMEMFQNNALLQKALETYQITGKMKSKSKKRYFSPEILYKLVISAKKDKPTIWESFKYMLGIYPKISLSKHYHSEVGTELLISSRTDKALKHILKIDA